MSMRLLTLVLTLGLAATALPFAEATQSPLTVQIVDVVAQRSGASVLVWVDLAGTAPDLAGLVGFPVQGDVDVTSPSPCWPDFPGVCAQVITTKTQAFFAVAGPLGVWEARVGPFEYPAAPRGVSCSVLDVAAEVQVGAGVASDEERRVVCAA